MKKGGGGGGGGGAGGGGGVKNVCSQVCSSTLPALFYYKLYLTFLK